MNLEGAGVSLFRAAATVGVLLVGAAEVRSQPACTYTLSPGGATIQSTAGSGLVSVSTTPACFWQARSLAPWISTMGSGGGNGSVGYYVGANTTVTVRIGGIEIAGQTFTITQAGAPCTYSLTPPSAAIGSAGGSGLVTVTAPAGCPWQATSQAPWISTMGAGSGSGGSFSFSVGPNPTGVARSGTIAVAGLTFSVTQAAPCTYGLSPTSAPAGSGGGGGTFKVGAPDACSWEAVSRVPWIHVTGTGASKAVTYSVDPNPAAAPRSGSIVVASQTFTVTQAAAPCTYSLSPTQAPIDGGGGGGTIAVTAPIGCTWHATSQASWISTTSTGNGNGSVAYSVAPNPEWIHRNGAIVVAGQSFTVSQAAAPCTYSLSPTQAPIGSGDGGGTFAVTAPKGCTWHATSQASWISTTSTGNGNGSVAYSVAANLAAIPRDGAIAVAGRSFTVTQAAAPCTYSLSPTPPPIGSGGGGGTIAVTAPIGCTWHATSQASWIRTTSTGNGNGSVAYSVDPNLAGIPRDGAIVVAGRSFTVRQAAGPCTYAVSPAEIEVGASGVTGSLDVTAPVGCQWSAASPDTWISASTTETGSGRAAYTIDQNPHYNLRRGTITIAGKVVAVTQDPAVADDTLSAGERLYPDQKIVSGSTKLLYQRDNNLVLYQNNSALWASGAGLGRPTDRFEMQRDCNAVVYGAQGHVWASGTNGQGSSCSARVIEGDWFICSGSTRVFSARGGGTCPTDGTGSSEFLRSGESLLPGQCRISRNGQFRLCYQSDGYLVFLDNGTLNWSLPEQPASAGAVTLEPTGNLVIRDGGGGVVWESGDVSGALDEPPALQVLDIGDVVMDEESALDGPADPPQPPAGQPGTCDIEIFTRNAFNVPTSVHDVVRITKHDGSAPRILNMQGGGIGLGDCGAPTCNKESPTDCPGTPVADIYHDTRKTWDKTGLSIDDCNECIDGYLATVGYPYRLADSNGAVRQCFKKAGVKGPRLLTFPPLKWLGGLPFPAIRTGRHYEFPWQRFKKPQDRCAEALQEVKCAGLASYKTPLGFECPTICGDGAGSQKCQQCQTLPECQVCTATSSVTASASLSTPSAACCAPTTSCSQEGAQCGTISNGCEEVSCPNSCYPDQDCVDNQCCMHAVGDCDYAYDECEGGNVSLGSCFFGQVCENNWCVNDPCVDDPCQASCGIDWPNWCFVHYYDHLCCQDLIPQ